MKQLQVALYRNTAVWCNVVHIIPKSLTRSRWHTNLHPPLEYWIAQCGRTPCALRFRFRAKIGSNWRQHCKGERGSYLILILMFQARVKQQVHQDFVTDCRMSSSDSLLTRSFRNATNAIRAKRCLISSPVTPRHYFSDATVLPRKVIQQNLI